MHAVSEISCRDIERHKKYLVGHQHPCGPSLGDAHRRQQPRQENRIYRPGGDEYKLDDAEVEGGADEGDVAVVLLKGASVQ